MRTLRRNDLNRRRRAGVRAVLRATQPAGAAHRFGLKVPLVQLTAPSGAPYDLVAAGDPRTYAQMTTPAGLKEISTYVDVLGPDKAQIFPRDLLGNIGAPTTLVADAHQADLKVVPYTFRAENQFLPLQYRSSADPNAYGDLLLELTDFFAAGVDGLFTDQPDVGFAAREDFLGHRYGVEHPQAKAAA